METKQTKSDRQLLSDFLIKNFGNDDKLAVFDKLTELYNGINSVINISSLKTEDDIYIKHYLDSIYPYKYFSGRCCDVGCGGGFPCIPLAIVTKLNFTGIESIGKKLKLIDQFTAETGINNITGCNKRAEELAKQNITFDTVCARAVAQTDKVLSYCAPLTAKYGKIILYKTPNSLNAAQKTLDKYKIVLIKEKNYELPGTDIQRKLFIYQKEGS